MKCRVLAVSMVVVATACSQRSAAVQHAAPATRHSTPTTGVKSSAVSRAGLDAIASRYRAACKSPGAAVSVRTGDGAVDYALSGGFAPGVALGVDSQFLAGSVTKLLVAAVAYQLIAAHELSLDDTVDRYVPNWPNGNRITIAMLLGHRSGMGDFGNDFGRQLQALVLSDLKRVFTYREVLDLVRKVPPVAPPGATYHYSNANYIVLGAILQRRTHETLGRLIDARVIKPLRLTRTLYGPDDLAAANKIVYHGLFDVGGTGTPVDIGGFPRNAALTVDPAGAGLFSSLPDLLTLTHALFATDDVLASAQRAGLDRAVSTLSAKDLLLDNGFVIHGHGGASPGAQTIVAYDRAHDLTVAVWCNRLDPGEYELLPSVVAAKETFELAAAPGRRSQP
jgi:D-alanyl-D-alanine carboxypeptidase